MTFYPDKFKAKLKFLVPLSIIESLLISSLPDKASRTLIELRGSSSDSTCVL